MNEEKWKEIQKNIKLPIQHLLSLSNNPQTLWNSFQTIIETKIIPQIPQKKIKINHQNLFNKKGTLYHKRLQTINSTLYHLKKQKKILPIHLTLLTKLNKHYLPHATYKETIYSLKIIHKSILLKFKIENKLQTQELIKKSIQKNINDLTNSPKLTIQNIL